MAEMIFVSNLPARATKVEIKEHFTAIGEVHSVTLKTDRKGRSRCFGFLHIENADNAVSELNEKEFQGRKLNVQKAYPHTPSRPGFFFRGGGGHRN